MPFRDDDDRLKVQPMPKAMQQMSHPPNVVGTKLMVGAAEYVTFTVSLAETGMEPIVTGIVTLPRVNCMSETVPPAITRTPRLCPWVYVKGEAPTVTGW